MAQAKVVLTPERIAEVDEAIWLRAREGDVAAAKLMYARMGDVQGATESTPKVPPTFDDLKAMFLALEQQQKALNNERTGMDDADKLGVGKVG